MKEAMERYGVSSGSLNSALTYGYSTGGYHFYRADEPKPDDSFFKSGNGGKGSSKKRPVICLETGVQFESAIAALKWLDSGKTNNRGNMRTALISGSALLGYHFYYADEQTPRRWKRMEGKRPACGGNLVTWHPGELHLTREDVRKPPALQKDISIAT